MFAGRAVSDGDCVARRASRPGSRARIAVRLVACDVDPQADKLCVVQLVLCRELIDGTGSFGATHTTG